MSEIRIELTEDGSATVYNEARKEHYHSVHGAVQESLHVFIEAGFIDVVNRKSHINILEAGFGTGLNALLTLMEYRKVLALPRKVLSINYHSIEPYPIDVRLVNQLNYCQHLQGQEFNSDFLRMHQEESGKSIIIDSGFSFIRHEIPLQSFETDLKYDLVYFDAFSPEAQPELWTPEVFSRVFKMINKGGVFVTYCSKGVVRRNLQELGFSVERLKGPPGKHEMLRATVL